MGTPYFPGCTLSTKAKNFDLSGRAVAEALGLPLDELADWQCCGATFPLAVDNSMALVAPAQVLIQAEGQNDPQADPPRLATLCAICYNVLKRTSIALREHPEQLERINWFISTDATSLGASYQARVKVVHFLEMLRDELGWDALRQKISDSGGSERLKGLRVAPYYGCLLLRPPDEMGLDDPEAPAILSDFLRAVGAEPVEFPFQSECCGSYLAASQPDVPRALSQTIVEQAARAGAQAIVTACPLCQYNLDKQAAQARAGARLPIVYFTQLLAVALGLPAESQALEGHYVDPAPLFARA
ncbi:MAG: CoB--CoM heterodisulfide reductase iron-sulfur subunit B family protein [Thermoflexales bacterium]|nr:CoB--CoM heterodisulfide reductase iron-sulfur subunit B family protein [Thermoflexales bacterium]